MRKNIVAGNWKMNTTLPEGIKLAEEVNAALAAATPKCDVIICVPFTHLASVNNVIDKNKLGLGAENCADHKSGAYTGEVSAPMVASTGANYVILGHSERRQYYGETSETLREKVRLALDNSLTPIFCIGEVLEERENGTFFDVVKAQIEEGLFNLSAEEFGKIILAYEPVWRSAQARPLPTTRLRRCTLSSARPSPTNTDAKLPTTPPSYTAAAASPPMQRNFSQNPTLTAVSSVAQPSRPSHS